MKINLKFSELNNFPQSINAFFKHHIILIWSIVALALILYVGHIFYFKIYMALSQEPVPTVKIQTAQKNQLDQILEDLKLREENRNQFDPKQITNPFRP